MNKNFIKYMLFIVAIFSFLLYGCTGKEKSEVATAAKEDITVGVVGPETGLFGYVGTDQYLGVQIAADEINSSGGIDGRNIVVVHRDDEGNPVKGTSAVAEFIDRYKVVGWFGSTATTSTIAIAEMTNDLKRPMIGVLGTGYKVVYPEGLGSQPRPWVFRISMGDWAQGSRIAKYVAESGKYKKPAIVHDTDSYGVSGSDYLIKELAKYGMKPAAVESVERGTTDLTPQLLKVRASGADIIIVWMDQQTAAHLAKGRKAMNYNVDIAGFNTLVGLPNYRELAKEASEGTVSVLLKEVVEESAGVKKFFEAYKIKTGKDSRPTDYAVESYVSAVMFFDALKKAGTDPEKLRAYLNNLKDYDSIIGKLSFSEMDHEAIKAEHLTMVIIRDGKVVKL